MHLWGVKHHLNGMASRSASPWIGPPGMHLGLKDIQSGLLAFCLHALVALPEAVADKPLYRYSWHITMALLLGALVADSVTEWRARKARREPPGSDYCDALKRSTHSSNAAASNPSSGHS